jgi:predicted nucleic acid-binding protein
MVISPWDDMTRGAEQAISAAGKTPGKDVRLGDAALPADRADEVADALESGRIAACLPFMLEAGYSARTAWERDQLFAELLALPHCHLDDAAERRALDAQTQLARVGHHRVPPVDLLIAALADRHGLGILHYDHDYDLIAETTDLRFDSVWLAARGTL